MTISSRQILHLLKRHPALYDFVRHRLYSGIRSLNRRRIFLNAFKNNIWADKSSVSGIGSSLEATESLRAALPGLITDLGIASLLDIPCGDVHWMRSVPLGSVTYCDADIVKPLIEQNAQQHSSMGNFVCLDLLRDPLPQVDAIFCRDCLVHLSLRDIRRALRNIRKAVPKYLLTTTFPECEENINTVTPYWRPLNLEEPPFNFPPPVTLLQDYSPDQKNDKGKYVGVWKTADLPER